METASSLSAIMCGLAILMVWATAQLSSPARHRTNLRILGGVGLFALMLSCISPYDDGIQHELMRAATPQAQTATLNPHVVPGRAVGMLLHAFPPEPAQPVFKSAIESVRKTHPIEQKPASLFPIHSPPFLG